MLAFGWGFSLQGSIMSRIPKAKSTKALAHTQLAHFDRENWPPASCSTRPGRWWLLQKAQVVRKRKKEPRVVARTDNEPKERSCKEEDDEKEKAVRSEQPKGGAFKLPTPHT
jgi:hypothetical protein